MFTVYYANQLEYQKQLLIRLLEVQPLDDPFSSEIILVQSPGMAQWLQIQLADHFGIAANFSFPMPSTFIWQLYKESIPAAGEKNLFRKEALVWRLMRIIPELLPLSEFKSLQNYLGQEFTQLKLFQLAEKIADLFDQYLVYRPDWINQWEAGEFEQVKQSLTQQISTRYQSILPTILSDFTWQAILWRKLIEDITSNNQEESVWHRANLYQHYLNLLAQGYKPKYLPKRICIFGISALPPMFLTLLEALSDHLDVHLFFNSPSRYYWGDIVDHRYLEKLKLKQLTQSPVIKTVYDESLSVGHPLLAAWGKLGRDFLYSLTQAEPQEIELYVTPEKQGLLQQIQKHILELDLQDQQLVYQAGDHSLSFHACYSPMREVEVLHDNLLAMFTEDPTLTPKDIVVMVADIDRYTPYIQAVFSQYNSADNRHIPFVISDRKVTESDVVIAAFLQFFKLKESLFSVESVLALLDVDCVRQRFAIDAEELQQIREWVVQSGIRFGLEKYQDQDVPNYNAWQNGVERMLLGYALKNEAGVWQDTVGFDYSEGLQGKIAGKLAQFIEALQIWYQLLQQTCAIEIWRTTILYCIDTFFDTTANSATIALLKQVTQQVLDTATESQYSEALDAEIISQLLQVKLNEQDNSVHFLMGQLNFCTLLPMRAIPFKVICLLGMNEGDFPRQLTTNSFDIMQYQLQKGDRVRREDDSYLFLEALLSARERLYISYVGYSIIDNTEYEPSVLVNQLIDYLGENLSDPEVINQLKFTYPATIFSPTNFIEPHFSYAQEWAEVAMAQIHEQRMVPFVQPISPLQEEEQTQIIELDDLIRFLVAPQRYFFEQRLGVFLQQQDDTLMESEVFALNGLAQYQLKDRLLQQEKNNWQAEFEKAKCEGLLPRAGFTFLSQAELEQNCSALWDEIEQYRITEAESLKIALPFSFSQQSVMLQGQIDSLYQDQFIGWRVGKIREQEQIKLWINHLLLQIAGPAQSSLFFGLEAGAVTKLNFDPLNYEQAFSQMEVYIQDYLMAQREMCLIPTYDLDEFIKFFSEEENDMDTLLLKLNQIKPENKQYQYWQRILLQTSTLDYQAIKSGFLNWFEVMFNHIKAE